MTRTFIRSRYAQRRWRVFQRWDAQHAYWIQVAAPLDERDELMRKMLRPCCWPCLRCWCWCRRRFSPACAAGLEARCADCRDSLSVAPRRWCRADRRTRAERTGAVHRGDRPAGDRLKFSLDHERRFTADAAHELRNPLAALRLELDLAGCGADAAARTLHLQRARDALDRMERLVRQLLILARVEKLAELDDAGPLAAWRRGRGRIARSKRAWRIVFDRVVAGSRRRRFVHGSRGLLDILVQNLLDNALRHTPEGGRINLRVDGHADTVMLEVNDSGTGFAATDLTRLGERFHRPAASVGEGSGLGLSIAQAIADLHHGQLQFRRSALGGAQVSLILPRLADRAIAAARDVRPG